jgi:hypothetical protein
MLRVVGGHVPMIDFQKALARAGHAHVGVLVTLDLVGLILADAADTSGLLAFLARSAGHELPAGGQQPCDWGVSGVEPAGALREVD